MKETEKLKLKLPENSDWADIVALNDNFQALDRWLEQITSVLQSSTPEHYRSDMEHHVKLYLG